MGAAVLLPCFDHVDGVMILQVSAKNLALHEFGQ